MSETLTVEQKTAPTPSKKNRAKANLMVCGCTILGAAAQMLIKKGIANIPQLIDPNKGSMLEQLPGVVMTVAGNLPLFGGLSCYGLSTGLLVLALRYGELSTLYPIIALTYVWVSLLSVMMLGETMNAFKLLGLAIIVLGVAVLGRGPGKEAAAPTGNQDGSQG